MAKEKALSLIVSLDQIVREVQGPVGLDAKRSVYDLGRMPTKDDLRVLRVRIGQKFRDHDVTVQKEITDMVTVTIGPNPRGWSSSLVPASSSPTEADDRLLNPRLKPRSTSLHRR